VGSSNNAAVGDHIRAHWALCADYLCMQVLVGTRPVPEWQAIPREVPAR
jgi:hypothetical protein